tara:strand:+ start:2966 stop:3349 length:384 start_codon:yes stop_codon:yes gene_type:complete
MAQPEWITEVRFFSTESNGRSPEGRGSVTIGGAIYINFTIWGDKDGGFQVTLPRTPNTRWQADGPKDKTNRKYYEEVGCCSAAHREGLTRFLVDSLLAERNSVSTGGGASDFVGGTTQGGTEAPIPF